MKAISGSLLLLSALLTFGGRAIAAPPPKAILFIVSGVGYAELSPSGPLAKLRALADHGSVGLLDATVNGEPTEAATFLTIGAGEKMVVPDKTGPKYKEGGIDRTVADIATEAFRSDTREGEVVCQEYRRRYGEYPPLRSRIIHIGMSTLAKAQRDSAHARQIGALGETLHRAGKRVTVLGDWQSVLIGMDKRAAVYDGALRPLLPSEIGKILSRSDVLIYNEQNPRRALQFAPILVKLAARGQANILLACLPRPFGEKGGQPVIFALGSAFPANSLLTSVTTGKPALTSSTDIAPTIARLAGMELTGGTGHPLTTLRAGHSAWDVIDSEQHRKDFLKRWGIFFLIGLALALLLVAAVFVFKRQRRSREGEPA